jgi:uncharacterized protein YheU (UPF0270 family)
VDHGGCKIFGAWSALSQSRQGLEISCEGHEQPILSGLALVRAEIGDKDRDIQDQDVWTAVGNLHLLKGDTGAPSSISQQWTDMSDCVSKTELRLDDAKMCLAALTQENDQKNHYLIQHLRGVADAEPCYFGPPHIMVERFILHGGTDYGDLLERRLHDLEATQTHGGARITSNPAVNLVAFRNLQSQVSQLLATVGEQGLELSQLKGWVGQVQEVEIHGQLFQSVLDMEHFILKDYPSYSKGLFFDAVSLLQVVHGNMGKSGEQIIESEYHAKRSNYSSNLDAKYSASFKAVVLPTIFGAVSAGIPHACALPAVKTFAVFDPQDGMSDGKKHPKWNCKPSRLAGSGV